MNANVPVRKERGAPSVSGSDDILTFVEDFRHRLTAQSFSQLSALFTIRLMPLMASLGAPFLDGARSGSKLERKMY